MPDAKKDRLLIKIEEKRLVEHSRNQSCIKCAEKYELDISGDSEKGVQPEKESFEKNTVTTSDFLDSQHSAAREVERVYRKYSMKDLLGLVKSKQFWLGDAKRKLAFVKSSLNELEPLRLALKQKFILETIELVGKQDESDRQSWELETSCFEKWRRFLSQEPNDYPYVDGFVNTLKNISPREDDCWELIKFMFNMTERMMQIYFLGGPLSKIPVESQKLVDAVSCLENIEDVILMFYRFDEFENKRGVTAEVTAKPQTGNSEGVQPQDDTERKNAARLSAEQRDEQLYSNLSRKELLKLIREVDVEKTEVDSRIINIRILLENLESIQYVAKLRFILETLEWYGKPRIFSRHTWNFEVDRSAKWQKILTGPSKKHYLVQCFLDCLKTSIPTEEERLQSIKLIFRKSYDLFEMYFMNNPLQLHILKQPRLEAIVGCLETMAEEIFKFHSSKKCN